MFQDGSVHVKSEEGVLKKMCSPESNGEKRSVMVRGLATIFLTYFNYCGVHGGFHIVEVLISCIERYALV